MQVYNNLKIMKYLSDIVKLYSNIDYNNSNKKSKILIVFDDMIADMFLVIKTLNK